MRKMTLIFAVVLSVLAGNLFAQTSESLIEEVRSAAKDACVTLTYSMNAKVDDVSIEDKGTVVAQDDLWYLKGKTIEIYTCPDGTWILHPESKEAMIEPKWTYDDLESFYGTLVSSSGNDVDVTILSRSRSEKKPVSFFIPETGQDWVVTDLR